MEINEIKQLLNNALQSPENISLNTQYGDAIAGYLEDKKSTDEIISIVIQGIDIDRAANYYDYLESVPKNDLPHIWKQIRQNREIKENTDLRAFKFIAGLLAQAFLKVGNMDTLLGNIIALMVDMLTSKKKEAAAEIYGPIILDYVLDVLDPKTPLPKWDTIKTSEDICKQFAELLLVVTANDSSDNYKPIRQWAGLGVKLAEESLKKKEIESKIPKSRISELSSILEHYRSVESQFRDSVYANAALEDKVVSLHQQINLLQREAQELNGQIRHLNAEIDKKEQLLDKAEKEIGEHTAINEAFGALKKNDETALLKDIGNDLKTEYRDFLDSESDEMDLQLGDIYREKIKNIFKILNKKGITME